MLRSSGDLAADRRYRYAQDCLKDGDARAAADLFRQVLELAPGWSPAWFGLGEAGEAGGDRNAAIEAFGRALTIDPADRLGARPRLARLGALDPVDAMTPGYVAALFDEYAPRFDAHLTEGLGYRGPAILVEALRAVCVAEGRAFRFQEAIDLGCGTGLMAAAIAEHVAAIDGVDLSPAMVDQAGRKGLYRRVWVGDVVEALEPSAARGQAYDLILAADVLVYIGELRPLFLAAAQAMLAGALFAFTTQAHEGEGFAIGPDLRFHHAPAYVVATAEAAGLRVRHAGPCVTRRDAGRPVNGHAFVLERPHE